MKIRQDNRNMLLLVTLLSVAAAGLVAGLDVAPATGAKSTAAASEAAPVRVVGTPFIPNTNPRER